MNRKELIRICREHDEYCQGCPYVTEHGACTVGRPWKQSEVQLVTDGDIK